MKVKTQGHAFLFSVLSAALFALQFPLIKYALEYISAIQAASLEALFTIFYCLVFEARNKSSFPLLRNKKIILGGVTNALGLIFLFEAINVLHPTTVGFLGRLYFVYTSLIALFYFREYPSFIELIAVPGTILGLFLFSFHDFDTSEMLGIGIAALYPLFFALQNMIIKESLEPFPRTQIILYNKIWSFLLLACYGIFREKALFFHIQSKGALIIGISSFLSTFLGLLFFLQALKDTKFSIANIVKGSEILFVLLFSQIFFPQALERNNIIGACLVFLCLVLLGWEQLKKTTSSSPV